MTIAPGTPSWTDLGSADVGRSRAFYTGLFGWTADEPGGPETGGYQLLRHDGKAVAGLRAKNPEDHPQWRTYVGVDDADAAMGRVTDAGGTTLLPALDVVDRGRMAVFADPQGAQFAVWEPHAFAGSELFNEPVSLTWNELNTSDVEAAKAFYGAVFGWGTRTSPMGDMEYTEWLLGDKPIAGALSQLPGGIPPHWLVYFSVADTDATVARAKELGGVLHVGPTDIPAGRFAMLTEPDGAAFGLIAG